MDNRGFTLIEMMIVLLIISTMLLISIPNVAQNNKVINAKGCEALVKLVEAQVQAYQIDTGSLPSTLEELVPDYITADQKQCPDGSTLTLSNDGVVSAVPATS
jgi:competence protein ComGC